MCKIGDTVLVRNSLSAYWSKGKLDGCYIGERTKGAYRTGALFWNYCIPFKGNEHLVGTCKDPENKEEPMEPMKKHDLMLVRINSSSEWFRAIFDHFDNSGGYYCAVSTEHGTYEQYLPLNGYENYEGTLAAPLYSIERYTREVTFKALKYDGTLMSLYPIMYGCCGVNVHTRDNGKVLLTCPGRADIIVKEGLYIVFPENPDWKVMNEATLKKNYRKK